MDDDVFLANNLPISNDINARTHPAQHDNMSLTDTVGIFVEAEWGSATQTGIQLCPAVFIPSAAQIPRAVKHIYSRLAASAAQLDQGVPEMLITLVGTGNSFSFENTDRLVRGLGHLISRCSLWAISSGEQHDPLASALSIALRSTLGQQQADCQQQREEILQIVVNSIDVHHIGINNPHPPPTNGTGQNAPPTMTDARLNTFYMVWSLTAPDEQQLLLFRACAAIKLANPPPALLIGVPEERSSATGLGPFTQSQTPISGPNSAAAILLPSAPSTERQPLPLVLFCGATLGSLFELLVYAQCGIAALVVQDISELCVVLKAAFTLFQSASFEQSTFDCWLDRELRMVALATVGHYNSAEIQEAKRCVFQLILTVSSAEHSLLAFMHAQQLDRLGEQALNLLVRNAIDAADLAHALEMALKVGAFQTLNSVRLEDLLAEQQLSSMLRTAFASNHSVEVLATLMDQNVPLLVDSNFLLGLAEDNEDQYFFNTIVLGHLLGLEPTQLKCIDEQMAKQFNSLMTELCGGVSNSLFPNEHFVTSLSGIASFKSPQADPERTIRLLAIWALLLNQPEQVRLLVAYSSDPMALCLALAKSARSLARSSRAWFFYEQSLLRLSHQLSHFAVQLLDAAYAENPARAYNALCRQMTSFRHLTMTQLAFETNNRGFLAHECCQRWVLRLLHGHIQTRSIWRRLSLSNWLKVLLSALCVWPIAIWIRPRHERPVHVPGQQQRPVSPTVALLEDGRQPKKVRSSSANSMHSTRSGPPYGGGTIRDREDAQRRNSRMHDQQVIVQLGNGAAGLEADGLQQMSTNDDSTLTDSFLPSASQMRGGDDVRSRTEMDNCRRLEQRREAEAFLAQQRRDSRRQSPDRRSLAFYDGIAGGSGGGSLNRRRSRTNSRLLPVNPSGGAANGHFKGKRASASCATGFCPSTMALFYAAPITKYWLSLAFRLLYLLAFGWVVAQPGCFLSGWREQLLWLWALCWLLDSLWVFVCRAQLADWRQQRWASFDLVANTFFLLSLLFMRIATSINLFGWQPTAYELRASWALFLLYECHKTLFVYVPLSSVLGPMLVRIRLMVTRDLVNFTLLMSILVASSAVAIKATLFPDLSAQPAVMAETFGWTFQQLFITDLGVLRQSDECQRQLLSERRPFCQALGGYANPRCPAQHWLAQFTVFEYLVFIKLLSWPILFALFTRTAKRVEEEADRIWKYQLYALATGFSLRPCLPPPLTPLFLILLACCRFGAGGLSCIFHRGIGNCFATDHPDVGGQAPHTGQRKFSTVYKNPSVLMSRGRPLNGFWRRLAIGLWKSQQKRENGTKAEERHQQGPSQDKASLLMGFNALRQELAARKKENGVEEMPSQEDDADAQMTTLKVNPSSRDWLHLLPDYRPNSYSKPADQFPVELQKHVDDASAQGLVELAKQWRQHKLVDYFKQADKNVQRVHGDGILVSGNGLPLNPKGRTGLAGRGAFACFGPNRLLLYALFRQQSKGSTKVLVQCPSCELPSRWSFPSASGRPMVDEFLAQLLLQLGLSDPEIHALSTKTGLGVGQRDGPVGHMRVERLHWREAPQETDNAWIEPRLWAVELSAHTQLHQLADGGEYGWRELSQLGDEQKSLAEEALAIFARE